MAERFPDRWQGGEALARRLTRYAGRNDVLVLALPRGGVPVAIPLARALRAPIDVFLVRKLGVPGHEELAMGAIASGGVRILNREIIEPMRISQATIDALTASETRELERREREYRGPRPARDPRGKIAILVDDGLATGASMRAAVEALRAQGPARIVVAVPVCSRAAFALITGLVDECVCASIPEPFQAVGLWYDDFGQVADQEVRDALERTA